MHRHNYKAVVLDMDGVMTQTARLHARAWKRMFDDFLQHRDERTGEPQQPFDIDADYRRYVDGKPRYDGVKSFLESRGIELPFGSEDDGPDQQTVCGLGNRKNELFHELLQREGAAVYDDTVEQIGRWKRDGLKVAVISASRNCRPVLKAAGLLDGFDAVIDGEDAARLKLKGKPDPDVFLYAAEQLGIPPSQVVIVEDAIAGVQAGRRGQFGLVVGVDRHAGGRGLREAGADYVVDDLRKLVGWAVPTSQAGGEQSPADLRHTPDSALEHFDGIADRVRTHRLGLFLDYDGTLTPIVRRPEQAVLSDDMRSLLRELSEYCTLAVVSGRDRENVERMVGVDDVVYAGSHGFDIRGPDGLAMQQQEALQALPELDAAEKTLRQRIEGIDGARVERKTFAIAVHYREVSAENDLKRVAEIVDQVVGAHSGLRKRGGKKIFELQPDVEWDKGRAVLWLAETLGLDQPAGQTFLSAGGLESRTSVIIYIGDDVTDEDAFRALRRGGVGIGIRVALPTVGTHAQYYLRDCDEVRTFLASLLDIVRDARTAGKR